MPVQRFEVYMLLKDRKRLARLIEIQEVSKREVAKAAGWSSHTFLLRLLSGQERSCKTDPAVKIARFLGVDVSDLFETKVSNGTTPNAKRRAA